jgi:thiamine biosynthesis lipoprotein
MVHVIKDVQDVLGTFVTITVVHSDINEGIGALHAAFGEIHRIHGLMTVHRQTSEVAGLNEKGHCERVSNETSFVIQRAIEFGELSNGVFDITVLPLLNLWRAKGLEGTVPTDAEISERLELVDYRNIIFGNKEIRFRKPGMGITLAGVAKGYAVDQAIEALSRGHIRHALVNAGGDIRALGGKTETLPWRVAIRDPKNKAHIATTIELYDRAVATSGTYQRSFNDIIHPKVGKPAQEVLSATVVARNAIDADILATCMLITGAEKSKELLGGLEGVKAFVIRDDGTILN